MACATAWASGRETEKDFFLMDFQDFSDLEQGVILDCIQAVLSERFLWKIEFHTRIGLDKTELEEVLSRWPTLASKRLQDALAVQGCMRDAINDISDAMWPLWVRCSKEEALSILNRWSTLVDWESFKEKELINTSDEDSKTE